MNLYHDMTIYEKRTTKRNILTICSSITVWSQPHSNAQHQTKTSMLTYPTYPTYFIIYTLSLL